jgi:hypothetical protein
MYNQAIRERLKMLITALFEKETEAQRLLDTGDLVAARDCLSLVNRIRGEVDKARGRILAGEA